jgi:hypothetical protein
MCAELQGGVDFAAVLREPLFVDVMVLKGRISVLYSDRRAVQAIGIIDRRADQTEGLKGTLGRNLEL